MFVRPKRPTHTIDMAPLIDVVFLLLVFFMLTSSFQQPSLPLKLPGAQGTGAEPQETVTVSVTAEGRVAIDGAEVTREAFEETLRARLVAVPDKTVNFRGDRALDYGIFVELMDRARRTGATQFNIVHDPAP
jgi:biopolymer transport protein ExbD